MEKKAQLPSTSRVSLTESRSHAAQASQQSISLNGGSDLNKAAIDKEYLRNVLIQFFEHKDKRVLNLIRNSTSNTIGPAYASVVHIVEFFKGR